MRHRLTLLTGCLLAASCNPWELRQSEPAEDMRQEARNLFQQYVCSTCHRIPGVVGADTDVGPPLSDMWQRVYVAGVVPNTDENLRRWIRSPTTLKPQTTMPDLGVGEMHAALMAWYLRRPPDR